MALLSIFSILGYTSLLHVIQKRNLELNLFVAVTGIVSILYLFTFFGLLRHAAQFFFYLGLILLIVNFFLYALKCREIGKEFFSPGIVIFIGLSVLYWLNFGELTYGEDGDVLSHWGLVTKEMLLTSNFVGANSSVSLKDYPPGIHLFHYFVVSNTKNTEGTVLFSHFLFLLAPIIGFLKGISWKQPHWIVLIIATVFYLIHALGLGVVTLRIDHIVSVYFAMIIVFYFKSKWRRSDFLLLIPIFFVMPLIKNAASFLAILAVFLIFIDLVINSFLKFGGIFGQLSPSTYFLSKDLAWALVIGVVLCSTSVLSDFSWNKRVESSGISKNLRPPRFSLAQITNAFTADASEKEKVVIRNFKKVIVNPSLGDVSDKTKIFDKLKKLTGIDFSRWNLLNQTTPLSALERVGIVLLIFGFALFVKPNKIFRIKATLTLLYLSFALIAFLFSLLTYYLFVFGDYEGMHVMSAHRYMNSFLLSFSLVGFGFIFPNGWDNEKLEKNQKKELVAFSFCGILVSLLFVFTPPASRGLLSRQAGYISSRQMTQPQINFILSKVPSEGKIYVIYQPLEKENPLVAKKGILYDLSPLYANVPCVALGKPYFSGDVWTCDWSVKYWSEHLIEHGYTYVYLAKADDLFWKRYGNLFSEGRKPADFLFKLETDLLGQIRLNPVR
ncbi:MAG: hypothetical protein HQM13_24110 [SAR324 cluster bacterium]|nr:hypothetical protein [SAR324 cluster bacterium]